LQLFERKIPAYDATGAQLDAETENVFDFCIEDLGGNDRAGDARTHHTAGPWRGVNDRDCVTFACKMPGGRETGRTCADHGNSRRAVAARSRFLQTKPLCDGKVSDELLQFVHGKRPVFCLAITIQLARMLADAAADGRERVVLQNRAPREFNCLRGGAPVGLVLGQSEEPSAHVRATGTAMSAWRGLCDVDGAKGVDTGAVSDAVPDYRFFHFLE